MHKLGFHIFVFPLIVPPQDNSPNHYTCEEIIWSFIVAKCSRLQKETLQMLLFTLYYSIIFLRHQTFYDTWYQMYRIISSSCCALFFLFLFSLPMKLLGKLWTELLVCLLVFFIIQLKTFLEAVFMKQFWAVTEMIDLDESPRQLPHRVYKQPESKPAWPFLSFTRPSNCHVQQQPSSLHPASPRPSLCQ